MSMKGVRRLNFSEWGRPKREMGEISEVMMEGGMPSAQYYPIHPNAFLSAAELEALARGLSTIVGNSQ